jgi:hypothetical protein
MHHAQGLRCCKVRLTLLSHRGIRVMVWGLGLYMSTVNPTSLQQKGLLQDTGSNEDTGSNVGAYWLTRF